MKLIYSAITSLDGYVTDVNGKFDWAAPNAAVHAFVNEQERPVGTYLYGRSMYETMVFWETAHTLPNPPAEISDYAAIWQAANKVVYSTTLQATSSEKTTLEREFDADKIRRLKASTDKDISIGGPHLAAVAIKAGLVDECHLYLNPVVIGGGTHWLPLDVRLDLALLGVHRFDNGVVQLHYRIENPQ